MFSFVKLILKRMSPGTDRLKFALPRIFPISEPKLATLRIKNFISTYLAWKYGLKLKSKPVILQIETVRGCNLNCVMCGAGELKSKIMPFEQFKKIIQKFPESFVTILNFLGEPLLSKDIIRIIQYSQKRSIVILFSNLTILPSPEELINSGLFEINISIDSFDKRKYDFIRKSGDLKRIFRELGFDENRFDTIKHKQGTLTNTLEKVVENLKTLIQTRNKLRKKLPIISINSVFAKETKDDAEDIIRKSIELGIDRVKFQKLAFDVPGMLHTPDFNDFQLIIKLKEKYKNQVEIIPVNFEYRSDLKGYCFYAHFMVLVDVFGNIFPCCMPPIFENIQISRFGSIIQDNVIKLFEKRQSFIHNFRNNPPEFCKNCYLYTRTQ